MSLTGNIVVSNYMILIKTKKEIELMREGGKMLSHVLDMVIKKAEVGVGTQELDEFAEAEIKKVGGYPVFKGYGGFPTTTCMSINEEVVHGPAVPDRKLKNGDVLSIDIGMRFPTEGGMVTDMARTKIIGEDIQGAKKLLSVTKESLNKAIKKIKDGVYLGDISYTIQQHVEKNGFNVVRDLSGHGVGRELHEDPQILNFGRSGTGVILKAGMTVAIEPMIVMGNYKIETKEDGITFKTRDNSLSAHFEHTILITKDGADVLTAWG